MKILFLGDFLYDYDIIKDDIITLEKYIKENNLVTILNLEGPLKSEHKLKKPINLCSSSKLIEVLKRLNVKAVNLANNHIMDFCEEGLKNTIAELEKAGIGYFGAGKNLEEALNPYVLEVNKQKILLYGFGWNVEESINATNKKAGTAPLNFKLINKVITSTSNDVIPIFHFGYEYEKLPQPYHVKECRKIKNIPQVKAIIGHHPHVVQAFEKDKNIYYSLGNFYFGSMRQKYTKEFKYCNEVNTGIGIILDPTTWEANIIKISSFNEYTAIDNSINIPNLIDISSISTPKYDDYFIQNNNTINKKYIYKNKNIYTMFINKTHYYRRNTYKWFLRNIKWPLGRIVRKVIKKK